MRPSIDTYGLTVRDSIREVNSDQYLVATLDRVFRIDATSLPLEDGSKLTESAERKLLLVADGLGNFDDAKGASGSATAVVIEYVLEAMPWLFGTSAHREDLLEGELSRLLERVDEKVLSLAGDPEKSNYLGTALALAYVVWPFAFVVRVGSCAVHHYRDGKVERVDRHQGSSEDPGHSSVKGGSPGAVDAVLGVEGQLLASEKYKVFLEPGDALVLCTDGIDRSLDLGQMATIVDVSGSAEEIARNVAGAAADAGAGDNVTVVATRFLVEK